MSEENASSHPSFLFLFLCSLLSRSFLSLVFFLEHIRNYIIFALRHNGHIKGLWLCSMAVASSEGSVNLWLAFVNRQFLIFDAFYCKKLMFDCIMWDLSLPVTATRSSPFCPCPGNKRSWERMLLLQVITQRVEFGPCCGWLRTSGSVEVSRFCRTELQLDDVYFWEVNSD